MVILRTPSNYWSSRMTTCLSYDITIRLLKNLQPIDSKLFFLLLNELWGKHNSNLQKMAFLTRVLTELFFKKKEVPNNEKYYCRIKYRLRWFSRYQKYSNFCKNFITIITIRINRKKGIISLDLKK